MADLLAAGRRRAGERYRLTETGSGEVWGTCAAVDGLFGDPGGGIYELLGWVPEDADVRGRLGSRVWLVPDDEACEPWLLEAPEALARLPRAGSLVLTGTDDYKGPPEGHRGRVRVHDEYRWLGSCREFTRVLSAERPAPLLVLRGLAPSDRLRAALAKGTRRALDLEEAAVEVHDDHGEPLTDFVLRTGVHSWSPSPEGAGRIDLRLDGRDFTPVPDSDRPLWERWLAGPPDTVGAWSGLDTRSRAVWLELVRGRAGRRAHRDRPAGRAYALDGRHVTDGPGLYLALGEAVNGPGGYFGGDCDRDPYLADRVL
jgi:hypothetical protein